MYKCNHCNIEIPDKQAEGRVVKVGPKDNPKCYCVKCGEPVVYIPDMPQAVGGIHGAQATLISNSDNRITTNNYYGNGTPDEQIDTPYGPCRKSEARFCVKCRQWVPLTYINQEKRICYDCEIKEARESYDEGKSYFDIGLYDDAISCFLKYETICPSKELSEVKTLIGRCYYEIKDYKQALKYFVVSSRNNSDSLYFLGLCYYYGYGVPQDIKKAMEHILKAVQNGNQLAIIFIHKEEERQKQEERKRRIEKERAEEENRRREKELRKREEERKRKEELEKKELHSIEMNGRYGFADEAGHIIIPCNWKWAGKFIEGLANVEDDSGKMGFINKSGELVIPCVWKVAIIFSEGLSSVKDINDKWGFIDKTGKLIVPCIWSSAASYTEGFAAVDGGDPKFVNHRLIGSKFGYIDKTGCIISPCKWNYAESFHNGMGKVRDHNMKIGYVDRTGKLVIPCLYKDITPFDVNGVALAECEDGERVYIDKSGKTLISLRDHIKADNLYENKQYMEVLPYAKTLARIGFSDWQNRLGLMYDKGRGVAKDQYEAVKWYRKAAEQGYKWGQYNLALMYYDGTGVSSNFEEAAKWCKKAAEQGHANAQNKLGYMYYIGIGVGKDIEEAKKWYKKAAEQGNENAIRVLKEFNK